MEEAYVDTAEDTANKSREICFSKDFAFFDVFESQEVGVQKRLVFRVQLFLCGIEEMQ